jgi:hypothetical protein
LPYDPLLMQVRRGMSLNESFVAHTVFPMSGGADIIINNRDLTVDHPFHLRANRKLSGIRTFPSRCLFVSDGKSFYIVARGQGFLTPESYAKLPSTFFNTTNPLRRDTVSYPALAKVPLPSIDHCYLFRRAACHYEEYLRCPSNSN